MKRSLRMIAVALVALLLGSCTAMMSTSYGSSDLYRTDNRIVVAQELTAIAEADKARAEARKAQYEAMMAEAQYEAMTNELNYNTILADDYESAYARRLYGFSSPTYRLPSSYYNLATSEAMFYATAYDPAFYNVMVSGDQVWVEPKYITSMFGSWGATNLTFGIYASPWAYGWGYHIDPFYYAWWGYPRYSWYDWNWTLCYNPYYFGWGYPGYYPGYHPGYPPHHHPPHHPPMPPQHRPTPEHRPGGNRDGGMGHQNLNGNGHNTGSRYTSPTSNRNYGVSEGRGSGRYTGAVSTGINERRGSSGVVVNSSSGRTTRNNTSSTSNMQRSNNFRSSVSSQSTQSSSSFRSSGSSTSNRSGGYSSGAHSSSGSRSGGSTSSRR